MTRFFSNIHKDAVPYVPGEQPQDKKYIKLNTNESPFPPCSAVNEAVKQIASKLQLYSDPETKALREKMSEIFGVKPNQILMTNGSDEALYYSFLCFSDNERPLAFPDITYSFYTTITDVNNLKYTRIPLKEDFSIDVNDYIGINKTVVLANPNAPTGLYLPLSEIEKILIGNPDNILIVDEAYIDFGGESAVKLIDKYDNLLVVGTFSKSRSMAGGRLGYVFGQEELIQDITNMKNSINPFTVNFMSQAAGIATLENNDYYMRNRDIIVENRAWLTNELSKMGFDVIPSSTNFVFAKNEKITGKDLYLSLKDKGILVRYFAGERTSPYTRITIGTMDEMKALVSAIKTIIGE